MRTVLLSTSYSGGSGVSPPNRYRTTNAALSTPTGPISLGPTYQPAASFAGADVPVYGQRSDTSGTGSSVVSVISAAAALAALDLSTPQQLLSSNGGAAARYSPVLKPYRFDPPKSHSKSQSKSQSKTGAATHGSRSGSGSGSKHHRSSTGPSNPRSAFPASYVPVSQRPFSYAKANGGVLLTPSTADGETKQSDDSPPLVAGDSSRGDIKSGAATKSDVPVSDVSVPLIAVAIPATTQPAASPAPSPATALTASSDVTALSAVAVVDASSIQLVPSGSILSAIRASPDSSDSPVLDLSGNSLSGVSCHAIAAFLASHPNVHTLNLSWNRIGFPDVLGAAVAAHQGLTTLDLRNCSIDVSDAHNLGACLAASASLTSVDVRWNHLLTAGGMAIVKALTSHANRSDGSTGSGGSGSGNGRITSLLVDGNSMDAATQEDLAEICARNARSAALNSEHARLIAVHDSCSERERTLRASLLAAQTDLARYTGQPPPSQVDSTEASASGLVVPNGSPLRELIRSPKVDAEIRAAAAASAVRRNSPPARNVASSGGGGTTSGIGGSDMNASAVSPPRTTAPPPAASPIAAAPVPPSVEPESKQRVSSAADIQSQTQVAPISPARSAPITVATMIVPSTPGMSTAERERFDRDLASLREDNQSLKLQIDGLQKRYE